MDRAELQESPPPGAGCGPRTPQGQPRLLGLGSAESTLGEGGAAGGEAGALFCGAGGAAVSLTLCRSAGTTSFGRFIEELCLCGFHVRRAQAVRPSRVRRWPASQLCAGGDVPCLKRRGSGVKGGQEGGPMDFVT